MFYRKTGGANGKHNFTEMCTNVSELSKIVVQLFEHMYGPQFRTIPESTAVLQTKQFTILLPLSFISVVSAPVSSTQTGIELGARDAIVFRSLQKCQAMLAKVIKNAMKRSRARDTEEMD
jgi:hypothetical protein